MPTLMQQSIDEQPEAIRRLLKAGLGAEAFVDAFRGRTIRKVWILGSGTSLFAAMIAARSWQDELGIDCEAMSSLEFLDETEAGGLGPETLVLAISQSGASLILLDGIRRAKEKGALTAVITAHPEAPIPLETHHVIETHTGPEANMGKTKGFTTTAVAAVLLGHRIAMGSIGEADERLASRYAGLPDAFAEAIRASRDAMPGWLETFGQCDALYVVGAGAQVPSALEGALKVLEVAKMVVVPKELEEMMHGPFNGVGPGTGIVLVTDAIAQKHRLAAFLEGVKLIGTAHVVIAASEAAEKQTGRADLILPAEADPAMRAVLAVVPFQVLAHDLAGRRGMPIDTARYPQLYPVFASKSIHQ